MAALCDARVLSLNARVVSLTEKTLRFHKIHKVFKVSIRRVINCNML